MSLDVAVDRGTSRAEHDALLATEARRVYARYAIEVVERLGLCPYAARARLDGRAREVVMLEAEPDLERGLAVVDELARCDDVDVAFLLYPRATLGRPALAHFVERLRAAHQARPGGLVLTMEGFHPEAEADLGAPSRLVPFLRRTPDPTIQLTRLTALERVRRGTSSGTGFVDPSTIDLHAFLACPAAPPLHERIAETNLATVARMSAEHIAHLFDDIRRDRDESYARITALVVSSTR